MMITNPNDAASITYHIINLIKLNRMGKLLFVLILNIAFISNICGQGSYKTEFLGYLDAEIHFNPGETEATVEVDVPLGIGQHIIQAHSSIGLPTIIEGNKVFFPFRKNKLQRELEGYSPSSLPIPGTIIVEPTDSWYENAQYEVRIMWDYDNLFN